MENNTPMVKVVVVGEQYCMPGSSMQELDIVKDKEVGNIEMKDAQGSLLFKLSDVNGHGFRDKRTLLLPNDKPLLIVQKKLISLHKAWEVHSAESEGNPSKKLFIVKKDTSLPELKTHFNVFINHSPPSTQKNDGNDSSSDEEDNNKKKQKTADFTIKGNFIDREVRVNLCGGESETLIAEMKRKGTEENVLFDKLNFTTIIAPGVDQAFIAALIVLMDATHEE